MVFPVNANVAAPYGIDQLLYLKAEKNNQGKWFAFIKAPNNMEFKVTIGQVIGNNQGKIVKITSSNMTIEEVIKSPNGRNYIRKVVLKFRK